MKLDPKLISLLVTGVWIGLLLGLSFIEAPLKFTAPNMTTELGVGIGRIMFTVLNRIEIVLVIMLVLLVFFFPIRDLVLWSIGFLALIVAIQSIWLLPLLDERATYLLQGNPQPGHWMHTAYVLCEISKLLLLILLFFKIYRIEWI